MESRTARSSRTTIAKRLSRVAFSALERAFGFARLRGNPEVDVLHWVHQLAEAAESDLAHFLDRDASVRASFEKSLLAELDRLERGAPRVTDFSRYVDQLLEDAWVMASVHDDSELIRSGHVVAALLRSPTMSRALGQVTSQLKDCVAGDAIEAMGVLGPQVPEALEVGRSDAPTASPEKRSQTGDGPLSKYTQNLTEMARCGEVDPVIGRDHEIRQIVDILQRRRQNNPILTGEPGVGKTAVVEGLALAIATGAVPPALADVELLALDLGALQAGASMKGEFEARLKSVIEAVQSSSRPIILFIDEAHTLIGAGGAAGTGDAANLLKPELARGKLRTIAATTWAEYKRYFEKDPALVRRFQVIPVGEPSVPEAIRMLHGVRAELERHHGVEVLDEAIRACVELSSRYLPSRQLPDKAISLLDTAAARVAVGLHAEPATVTATRRDVESLELELTLMQRRRQLGEPVAEAIEALDARLVEAKSARDATVAVWTEEAEVARRIADLRRSLVSAVSEADAPSDRDKAIAELEGSVARLKELQRSEVGADPYVSADVVAAVLSDWTGIPLGRMVREESETVLHLARLLSERVVGQTEGHRELADRIRVGKAGLQDPTRPIGVFLLAGPSGVGKTETALALADLLYGGEQNLVSINMSEFQEAHTVSTLKGAPPGYVGYGEGGRLTEAVRRKPYSVVLLDEVEKAHPDVHEIFFQVFDKGQMEDSEGRRVDFRNCIILLTTNVGSDELIDLVAAGGLADPSRASEVIIEPLRQTFPDALLGRMKVVPFMPLSREAVQQIVERRLADLARRSRENYGVNVEFSDALRAWVHERARPTVFGARLVNAIVTDQVAPAVAQVVLAGDRYAEDALIVDVAGDSSVICVSPRGEA